MRFQDIKTFPRCTHRVNLGWEVLQDTLTRYDDKSVKGWLGLDMNPDFQRGHVWTRQQQIEYVEYRLMDGPSGKDIYFNHPNWRSNFKGQMVLVDGLQRITAALLFMENSLPAFGLYRKEYEGRLPAHVEFILHVAELQTTAEIYQWYIDFNAGGTPHTKEEIEKVKRLKNDTSH